MPSSDDSRWQPNSRITHENGAFECAFVAMPAPITRA